MAGDIVDFGRCRYRGGRTRSPSRAFSDRTGHLATLYYSGRRPPAQRYLPLCNLFVADFTLGPAVFGLAAQTRVQRGNMSEDYCSMNERGGLKLIRAGY
jgi:hypothetical protein